jgi:uncharacterized oligopeptide transporter (OPT) family protein
MQVVEIVAVILLSFFLMWPIVALHEANLDTGGIGGRALPAPQAGLMAQLANGIMGGRMAWGLLGAGGALAFALILCGARAPMLIAVGMYLPFDTTSAIFLGGLISWLASRRSADEERGTLLASGLIAGESVMGILLAAAFVWGLRGPRFAFYEEWGAWLSLPAFLALGWVLVFAPSRKQPA